MELEAGRKRDRALKEQIGELQNLLKKSRDWLQIDKDDLRHAISCGLELLGASPLQRKEGSDEYQLPDVVSRLQNEQSWLNTLDTLRPPRKRNQTLWDWRREAPIRPVVFSDPGSLDAKTVQLHLEHRFVQRLLGHFRSQGFVHHDLARACIGTTDDPIPRVILLGRLSLYGQRASRLHDEILAVAARWSDVDVRKEPLKPYAGSTLDKTLDLLDTMLSAETRKELSAEVRARLGRGAAQDLAQLKSHLQAQSNERQTRAIDELRRRGEQEASDMRTILGSQRTRIQQTAAAREEDMEQPGLFDKDGLKQLEADKRYWHRRLTTIEGELDTEPARILQSYEVKAMRFEPVGLVYLWPITG